MRSKPLAVTLAALAAVLAAVAGVTAIGRRRSSSGAAPSGASGAGGASGEDGPPPATAAKRHDADVPPPVTLDVPAAETTFTCECGHELRRVGEGRHTVYWELDADAGDPLLQSVCPNCERPLPSEHAAREV